MKKGFTLVEILLAVALLAVFLPALLSLFSFSTFSTSQGENFTQAYALAQQQMEVIYALKNNGGTQWDWNTTPAPGLYQLPLSPPWQLASAPAPTPGQKYTASVRIGSVYRNSNAQPLPPGDTTGTPDVNSRYITVRIEWIERTDQAADPQAVEVHSLVTEL